MEIGLEDDADVGCELRAGVEIVDELECDVGVVRAFHVDANEIVSAASVIDEAFNDVGGELRREVDAHLGELYADVGLEIALADGVEELMVDGGCGLGFFFTGDTLAE